MEITAESTISGIIFRKGEEAGKLIDKMLCDAKKICCPGTTLKLGYAAKKMKKEESLALLIKQLNALADRK